MRLAFWTVFLLLGGISTLFAQTWSVSGYVTDGSSGEALPGVTVLAPSHQTGAMTNSYGYFSLRLPADTITLQINFGGMEPQIHRFLLKKDTTLNLELNEKTVELEGVTITDDAKEELLSRNQMSVEKMSIDLIKGIPAFMGEVDIMKTILLLPGVQSGSEGSTGLHVRGGASDQNLILLDGAPVYNSSHLFGFFSIFNGDAVRNLELYKGAFPAKFGGRLSSVLDVQMKEGNQKKYQLTGGLGLISSRATLEGPLLKDKASFMIAGRRTYVDIFTRELNKIKADKPNWEKIPDYFFYDLNGKMNFELGKKDHLYASAYHGKDVFNYSSGAYALNFNWGNTTASLRWNHLFSDRLFLNTTAIFSHFNYNITNEYTSFEARIYSTIKDLTLKADFDYFPNNKHFIRFGYQHTYHTLTPRSLSGEIKNTGFKLEAGKYYYSHEAAAYFSDDITFSARSKLSLGLRLSNFTPKDTNYFNPEPRISYLYRLRDNLSYKASYSRMVQYIHLVSNSAVSLPTDIWYPTTVNVQPGISDQVATGLSWVPLDWLDINWEAFGKYFQHQSEFAEGASAFRPDELDSSIVQGIGWSYGSEIMLRKRTGKFTGWIAYTLSWSYRKVAELNGGLPYPNKYDRRHDISLVGNYEISPRFTVSATWIYGTGNAVTFAPGRFFYLDFFRPEPTVVPDYIRRNSYRMPAYHRLDLGLTWHIKPEKDQHSLTLSVYNAYNRRNTYFIYYDEVWNPDGYLEKIVARKVSLFPILPSVAWNFSF
ncbi:MAG: TonB-dependent receptor [Bacteroidia bacterium]|nr:TonB-dependent receptor [Bacteroidia bacterium]